MKKIPNIKDAIDLIENSYSKIIIKINDYNKSNATASIVEDLYPLFENFTTELNALNLIITVYYEENGLDITELDDIYRIMEELEDITVSQEFWEIEKIYNGETYAQFYKDINNVKDVCLQNDWAPTIRNRCEKFEAKVGGVDIVGCTGKDAQGFDTPRGCVLKYNYDKQICEPKSKYCNAYGMDETKIYEDGKKIRVFLADGTSKEVDASGLTDCSVPLGQAIMESVLGTTLSRLAKKAFCPTSKDPLYCCSNNDCISKKLKDKDGNNLDICAHKRCTKKYNLNEPHGQYASCNPFLEPVNAAKKPNEESPECNKGLFCTPVGFKSVCKFKERVRGEGESCEDDINCKRGKCDKGKCRALQKGEWCGQNGKLCASNVCIYGKCDVKKN